MLPTHGRHHATVLITADELILERRSERVGRALAELPIVDAKVSGDAAMRGPMVRARLLPRRGTEPRSLALREASHALHGMHRIAMSKPHEVAPHG